MLVLKKWVSQLLWPLAGDAENFSQWPNAIFKIPDIKPWQWLVIVTESRVVEEIQKAPEGVLSFLATLDEVSRFVPAARPKNPENMFRHFNLNTLSGNISPTMRIIFLLSEHNSLGVFHNSCQRFMKRLSMHSMILYPWPVVRFDPCILSLIMLTFE